MKLTAFISDLIYKGEVIVPAEMGHFTATDEKDCVDLLEKYYEEDKLEYAYTAPEFCTEAALWAARYFYYAVQLAVIREADDRVIKEKLYKLEGEKSPSVIYSIDLIFRQLPSLLFLVKGLAPSDPLVKNIEQAITDFILAAPAANIEATPAIHLLQENTFLWSLFIDRVIDHKNKHFLKNIQVSTAVSETLGAYSKTLWSEFDDILNRINEQQHTAI